MKKFIIDHIDPLGQGVYKEDQDIYFIPKTLPKEAGTFSILKSKKSIHFCEVSTIEKKSAERISPQCPHFEECPNCQFLHTDYNSEVNYKASSFKRKISYLKQTNNPKLNIIKAPQRLKYRNRIQLHYNTKLKAIGAIDPKKNKIVPIPQCSIMNQEVKKAYLELLENKSWLAHAKEHKLIKGHVEIYDSPLGLQVSWNQKYSHGGFTQVFKAMNDELNKKVSHLASKSSHLLDLFGGGGNLSNSLKLKSRTIVDIYQENNLPENGISLNLFKENALSQFIEKKPNEQFDTFIIDPPRKGFQMIEQWVSHYSPKEIIYVSCHPDTMLRDIKTLLHTYKIVDITMLDLFPSTYHFEGLIKLEKL